MKIVRRNSYIHPASTCPLWVIPLITYLVQKLVGLEFNEREYIWWIGISAMFIFWFFLNFKTIWKKKNY
jgi:hypothetical protein